jgi:hypothetical protein
VGESLLYPVEISCGGADPRGYCDPAKTPIAEPAFPQRTGERLFDWLFSDSRLENAWVELRGRYPHRRIRLRIDTNAPELHCLPWELLRDLRLRQDVTACEATPFSRYTALSVPSARKADPILERPIRILAAIAAPDDLSSDRRKLDPIDAEAEWAQLVQVFGGVNNVELVRLEKPCTLDAIELALKDCHVLHFIGHGGFVNERSRLFLADKGNNVEAAQETQIAEMFSRQLVTGHLRLVFLSSCMTATRSPADAFRGLAPRLVESGVPAVVAMQDLISQDTAREFTRVFYRHLLAHGEVDRACNSARSVLLTSKTSGAGVPVLFLRLKDGLLFDEAEYQVNQADLYRVLSALPADELQALASAVGAEWTELAGDKARSLIFCGAREKKLDILAGELLRMTHSSPVVRSSLREELTDLLNAAQARSVKSAHRALGTNRFPPTRFPDREVSAMLASVKVVLADIRSSARGFDNSILPGIAERLGRFLDRREVNDRYKLTLALPIIPLVLDSAEKESIAGATDLADVWSKLTSTPRWVRIAAGCFLALLILAGAASVRRYNNELREVKGLDFLQTRIWNDWTCRPDCARHLIEVKGNDGLQIGDSKTPALLTLTSALLDGKQLYDFNLHFSVLKEKSVDQLAWVVRADESAHGYEFGLVFGKPISFQADAPLKRVRGSQVVDWSGYDPENDSIEVHMTVSGDIIRCYLRIQSPPLPVRAKDPNALDKLKWQCYEFRDDSNYRSSGTVGLRMPHGGSILLEQFRVAPKPSAFMRAFHPWRSSERPLEEPRCQ